MQRSLKYNIDPLRQFTDDQIKDALKLIGFTSLIENDPNGLDMLVFIL